jgi:hypothetical protein
MSIVVVTAATDSLLTTVDAVKVELNISGTDDDAHITNLIQEASDLIKNYTGRVFGKEKVRETIGAKGLPEILLERTPIVSIEGITFNGLAITDYSIQDADAGVLFKVSGWTSTELSWTTFARHPSQYMEPLWAFTYWGGYVLPNWDDTMDPRTLPHDLERACIDIAKTLYKARNVDGTISRYKIGDTDVSWDKKAGYFSQSVSGVLDFYRRAY